MEHHILYVQNQAAKEALSTLICDVGAALIMGMLIGYQIGNEGPNNYFLKGRMMEQSQRR